MMIPGFLITIMTFPGYVMKTVATKFWCDVLGVPVYEAKYFKGIIVHEKIESAARAIPVALAPFTINTLLCAILFFPSSFLVSLQPDFSEQEIIILLLAWVGIAVGMHALPTRGEMKHYIDGIPADLRHGPSYIILCAAVVPFAVVDLFKFLWVDFVYAVAVGLAAPFAATYLYMALHEPQAPQSTSLPSVVDDLVTCKKGGDEAIAACSRVITSTNINPDDLAQAYVHRGAAYYDTQDYDRAIADYNEAIKLSPNDAMAFRKRGIAYADKQDYDRAIADYNEAIKLDPKDAVAFYVRGLAYYYGKQDYDRAIADYSVAIELDPKDALAFASRGDVYRAKEDYDRAIADYNEAIRLDPKDAMAFANRGDAYYRKQNYDLAIADYNEAIRLDPKDAMAFANRGDAYYRNQNYDLAIADYNEAIRLDPKYILAYFDRGFAHLYSGALDKAVADFSQASELDQTWAYTALWVDIVRQRGKLPSGLSQAISKIDMTIWPAPVIRMFLGQMTQSAVLAAANDPDPNKKKGQVCEANFYSGELALRMGAKNEALRLFRLAARDCPRGFLEWPAANAELKALGVAR